MALPFSGGALQSTQALATNTRGDIEKLALELAASNHSLPIRGGNNAKGKLDCPADDLEVSWTAPKGKYKVGGYVEPLGPAPTAETSSVNGIILCNSSHYAYLGFEAYWSADEGGWHVDEVPSFEQEDEEGEHANLDPTTTTVKGQKPAKVAKPKSANDPSFDGVGIDAYASYEGQSTCDPTPKPGTLALRDMLMSRYPNSKNFGISRGCGVGGKSEHKEGRAFDWGVNVNVPAQKQSAEAVIAWMLATDGQGNQHAMARRMGIMYIIWNHQIWSAYRANEGWRPYSGPVPHTDHVHFSMSWAGALKKTSYWSGSPVTSGFVPPPKGATWGNAASARGVAAKPASYVGTGPHPTWKNTGTWQRPVARQRSNFDREAALKKWREQHEAWLKRRAEWIKNHQTTTTSSPDSSSTSVQQQQRWRSNYQWRRNTVTTQQQQAQQWQRTRPTWQQRTRPTWQAPQRTNQQSHWSGYQGRHSSWHH